MGTILIIKHIRKQKHRALNHVWDCNYEEQTWGSSPGIWKFFKAQTLNH